MAPELRYTHIIRSEPWRLTAAFLHCRCQKGKQKHARDGFDYAVPACFSNGFFWAKEVLEAHRTLAPPSIRSPCRMRWRFCWTMWGDYRILMAPHGSHFGATPRMPTRGIGRIGRLAKQKWSARRGADGIPPLLSQVRLHQDHVWPLVWGTAAKQLLTAMNDQSSGPMCGRPWSTRFGTATRSWSTGAPSWSIARSPLPCAVGGRVYRGGQQVHWGTPRDWAPTRTQPQMSSRPWHGSDLGVTNALVVATGLDLILPNFWL